MAETPARLFAHSVQAPLWTENGRVHHVLFRRLVPDIPSTTYATFGLYRYPAKFIPQVIAYILRRYARPGMVVFDPFAGYGTVGLVAKVHGCPYILWDLNPLLEHLHQTATLSPPRLEVGAIIRAMQGYRGPPFVPDWTHKEYWHPPAFLETLSRAWGYYHSLPDGDAKRVLLVPLLKATRYFSYDDERVHKLYRSKRAIAKVEALLAEEWESTFFTLVKQEIERIVRKLAEYQRLSPKPVAGKVRGGVDTLATSLEENVDMLITSPPYLQAQEYIRTVKMDLFWLGYREAIIKELSRKEIPYSNVPDCPIFSETYHRIREQISELHLRTLFERYFCGVLWALTRLQEKVRSYLFLFVGPATLRLQPIPIGQIFVEHFTALGWVHETTLIDTIVGRVMFTPSTNPATGLVNQRIKTEHLVILRRKEVATYAKGS